VVELQQRSWLAGGAANTAANVAGLGAKVVLVGVIGADEAGQRLVAALAGQGIDTDGLFVEASGPTTTKTRIVAQNQQVVRVDHEHKRPLPQALQETLLGFIDEGLGGVDGCILSDYAKGVVSAAVAQRLIQGAKRAGKPVVVDPKSADGARYRGATLVKPNLSEAALLLRRHLSALDDVSAAGPRLLDLLGAQSVLLTRGAAGMTLFQQSSEAIHVAAQAREVFDVTGAGDTVAATLAVALAAGASVEQAARLASRAAADVVGRLGTSAVRLADLMGHKLD
jgi:D-beta-D-heptose 7-phosphate kinase/D-beta-D-heptose 1-phosphate adenosyltransferase